MVRDDTLNGVAIRAATRDDSLSAQSADDAHAVRDDLQSYLEWRKERLARLDATSRARFSSRPSALERQR